MAFRLKPYEPVRRSVRRLAAKELRNARKRLHRARRPSDEAIHEARKSLKKARAVLQLIEADGGRHLRGSRKRFRAVNRSLSPLRDAEAMLEILDKLKKRAPRLIRAPALGRLRRRLAIEKAAVM